MTITTTTVIIMEMISLEKPPVGTDGESVVIGTSVRTLGGWNPAST